MSGRRGGRQGPANPPAGILLTPAELTDMIAQAVATYANQTPQQQQQAPQHSTGSYKAFMDCKPHTFSGSEGAVGLLRWLEKAESAFPRAHCREEDKVIYAAGTLEGAALTWWNSLVQALGQEQANALTWGEFKMRLTREYCPPEEIEKLENEFWNQKMVGSEIEAYTARSHELALLCPDLATPVHKHIHKYIKGLVPVVKSDLLTADPQTLEHAIRLAHKLTDHAVEQGLLPARGTSSSAAAKSQDGKRKWDNTNPNSQNQAQQQPAQHRKFETSKNQQPNQGNQNQRGYAGKQPLCNKCNLHHHGNCKAPTCQRCGKSGHWAKNCRAAQPLNQQNEATKGCFF